MEEAERRFNTFRDRLHGYPESIIEHASVPLATIDERMKEIRSSVLIQLGEHKFIVSAAHEVGPQIDNDEPLFILMRNKEDHPLALVYEKFYATKESSIDLVVAKLHPSTVEYLGDQYQYVQFSQMMSKYDPRSLELECGLEIHAPRFKPVAVEILKGKEPDPGILIAPLAPGVLEDKGRKVVHQFDDSDGMVIRTRFGPFRWKLDDAFLWECPVWKDMERKLKIVPCFESV